MQHSGPTADNTQTDIQAVHDNALSAKSTSEEPLFVHQPRGAGMQYSIPESVKDFTDINHSKNHVRLMDVDNMTRNGDLKSSKR